MARFRKYDAIKQLAASQARVVVLRSKGKAREILLESQLISAMTIENSNHEDLSDLVHSIMYGNLHDRIERYLGEKYS